jgi:hypothetical protein
MPGSSPARGFEQVRQLGKDRSVPDDAGNIAPVFALHGFRDILPVMIRCYVSGFPMSTEPYEADRSGRMPVEFLEYPHDIRHAGLGQAGPRNPPTDVAAMGMARTAAQRPLDDAERGLTKGIEAEVTGR